MKRMAELKTEENGCTTKTFASITFYRCMALGSQSAFKVRWTITDISLGFQGHSHLQLVPLQEGCFFC